MMQPLAEGARVLHMSVSGVKSSSLSVNKLDVGGLLRLLLAPFVVEVPHLCG